MRKSHLLYKVNLHVRPFPCEILINDDDENIDASGPGKGTEVSRSASGMAIRRIARRVASLSVAGV